MIVSRINNLACVLDLERCADAEARFNQAAIDNKNILRKQHQYTLIAMQNWPLTTVKQGRHFEAEGVCRDALRITEEHRGNKSSEELA